MKVYLAGPMRGLPGYNFGAFHVYAYLLRKDGHEVFNPAELGLSQDNIREIFAVEMDWICREADAVALMPGWTESWGASAEAALARALNLEIMPVPGFHLTPPPGSSSLSEQPFSTTSRSRLRKLLESPSWDNDSTEPWDGTGLSPRMRLTLWCVTFFNAAVGMWMAYSIALNWPGGH